MKKFVFLLLFVVATTLTAQPNIYAKQPTPHVIVMSWDGFGAQLAQKARPANYFSMKDKGGYTFTARSVIPSITLPNHSSMISGITPDKHQVLWNTYEPSKPSIAAPTIFDLAKRNNLTVKIIVGKEKLRHLVKPYMKDSFILEDSAKSVATASAKIIKNNMPNLMFIHFPDPDNKGHLHGWESKEQLAAVKDCDNALAVILAAMKEAKVDVTLVMTADHGGNGFSHGGGTDVEATIPILVVGPGVKKTGEIKEKLNNTHIAAMAATLLGLKVPKEWNWPASPAIF